MKKGFTLLELIIVIVILGILATLGYTQYGRTTEKGRAAEARTVLGSMRKLAIEYYFKNGGWNNLQASDVGVGTSGDAVPANCVTTHYFSYNIYNPTTDQVQLYAWRCTSGGKTPNASCYYQLWLQLYNDGRSTFGLYNPNGCSVAP